MIAPTKRGRKIGFGNGLTAAIPRTRATPEQRAEYEMLGGSEWLRLTLDESKAKRAQTVPTNRNK